MEAEHMDSRALAKIHAHRNDQKWFCYFTGFLEGVVASGAIEHGEVEPLIAQCLEFVENLAEADANDIIEDFEADLLDVGVLSDLSEIRSEMIDLGCSLSAKNRFNGFCAGIACDGNITLEEAAQALQIIENRSELAHDHAIGALETTLRDSVADGVITGEEMRDICDGISRIIGDCYSDTGLSALGGNASRPMFDFSDFSDDLRGFTFVLTGLFDTSPRHLFEDHIRGCGGEVKSSVSKKVDFVLIGGEPSIHWIETHQGTKLKKSQSLEAEFGAPRHASEANFLRRFPIH